MQDITDERLKVIPYASGVVLEIGIGLGLNLPIYDPTRVECVIGVDPGANFLRIGRSRHATSPVPLEIIKAPAEALPLTDASIDTAVVTYTLCSVEDPMRVLAELRRVLKPTGRVLFLEHGLAHDQKVSSWQHRLNPIWKRLAVGCNLNRPVASTFEKAGFRLLEVDHYYLGGAPRSVGYTCRGVAVSTG
ncbi:class I SAM-dependent methyltransferase [Hyphomicrobium sp.]|jgi:ubiquinone/menaquinone biosynthesis C-methylase UbiE|uniref:class I SAM-dependent methyltransferase n=1 Tax=Hyphomicrobium sp. TaxID=82 RepID=UPI003567EA6D